MVSRPLFLFLCLALLCLLASAEASCSGEACYLEAEDGQQNALSLLVRSSRYLVQREDAQPDAQPDAHVGHTHLPLCSRKVVLQTCSSLSQTDHARHSTHMTKREFRDALSANDSVADTVWAELGFASVGLEVPCMDVCKVAVHRVSSFAYMPSLSDMACYTGKGGQPVCDLDVSPRMLRVLVKGGNDPASAGPRSVDRAAKKGPAALISAGNRIEGQPPTAEVLLAVPYSKRQLLLRLVNLFRIFPVEAGANASISNALIQNQKSATDLNVVNQQRLVQARVYLQYTTAAFVRGDSIMQTLTAKYFGTSTWENVVLRAEILRMLNQLQQVLNDADLVYPGAKCDSLLGAGGAVAYASPGAVDVHGHTAILYLCKGYYKDSEVEQVGTLIHELSHQESVGEDDFCRDKSAQWLTIWASQLPPTGWRQVNGKMVETSTTYLQSMWKYDGCSGWWWVRYNGEEDGKPKVTLECDPQRVHKCETQSYGQAMAELLAQQDTLAAVRSANNFERFVKDAGNALWQ